MRTLLLAACVFASLFFLPSASRAERGAILPARRGPWIVYRYPVFRQGNRPPEARRHSQQYYWPSDANERFPKFYGGFHARYFDSIGFGDRGFRGTAW